MQDFHHRCHCFIGGRRVATRTSEGRVAPGHMVGGEEMGYPLSRKFLIIFMFKSFVLVGLLVCNPSPSCR